MKNPLISKPRRMYAVRLEKEGLKKFIALCKKNKIKVQEAIDQAFEDWAKKWG